MADFTNFSDVDDFDKSLPDGDFPIDAPKGEANTPGENPPAIKGHPQDGPNDPPMPNAKQSDHSSDYEVTYGGSLSEAEKRTLRAFNEAQSEEDKKFKKDNERVYRDGPGGKKKAVGWKKKGTYKDDEKDPTNRKKKVKEETDWSDAGEIDAEIENTSADVTPNDLVIVNERGRIVRRNKVREDITTDEPWDDFAKETGEGAEWESFDASDVPHTDISASTGKMSERRGTKGVVSPALREAFANDRKRLSEKKKNKAWLREFDEISGEGIEKGNPSDEDVENWLRAELKDYMVDQWVDRFAEHGTTTIDQNRELEDIETDDEEWIIQQLEEDLGITINEDNYDDVSKLVWDFMIEVQGAAKEKAGPIAEEDGFDEDPSQGEFDF